MLTVKLRRAPREDARAPLALPLPDAAAVPAALRAAAEAAGFTGAADQSVVLPERGMILIGTGAARRALDWEEAGGTAAAAAGEARRLGIDARGLAPADAAALAAGACLRAWRFTRYRAEPQPGPRRLDLLVDDPAAVAPLWDRASAAVRGCLLARDLSMEPGNALTTRSFAARLEAHEAAGASGYRPLAPAPAHVLFLAELPVRREHRDPFSRMLAAQARREGLTLTTEDPRLGAHGVPVVGRG